MPILAITDAADVGLGSFYNHFGAREDLFRAAVLDALDVHGTALDQLTAGIADPAEAFATSFRLTGRFHRLAPQLSRVVLHNGLDHLGADQGLAPRARRDINAALTRGRFRVADIDVAMVLVGGAALALGRFLHDHPEADDARATDEVTEHLLVALGIDPDEARRLSQTPLPDLTEAVRR